ncbi:MAG: ferredoxin [Candidatus Nanopelagicales bacterium]
MRVRVDLNVCQGHGVCHMSAPEVYDLDPEDGHSIVMLDPVPPEHEDGAQLGVDSCPERAISVVSAAVGAANNAD